MHALQKLHNQDAVVKSAWTQFSRMRTTREHQMRYDRVLLILPPNLSFRCPFIQCSVSCSKPLQLLPMLLVDHNLQEGRAADVDGVSEATFYCTSVHHLSINAWCETSAPICYQKRYSVLSGTIGDWPGSKPVVNETHHTQLSACNSPSSVCPCMMCVSVSACVSVVHVACAVPLLSLFADERRWTHDAPRCDMSCELCAWSMRCQ